MEVALRQPVRGRRLPGDQTAHPPDGRGQRGLGRAQDPRRVAQARHRHQRAKRVPLHASQAAEAAPQTWRTFLDNHVGSLASIDFFTVPTATFRVLYVFFVLAHDRRRVLHFSVTEHPSAAWTAQQIVEAFPENTAPRFMLRDRDGIYGDQFRRRVQGLGIDEILSAPRSPWQNPYAERLVGSVRRECPPGKGEIVELPEVGGLHHRYERLAA